MADNKKELSPGRSSLARMRRTMTNPRDMKSLRESYSAIVAEALSSPFGAMLDIGCGTGALLKMIQGKRKDARLFGVDL